MNPKEDWGQLLVRPQVFTSPLALPDPGVLKIYDTTLRDGEQTPGVALSPKDKYLIAREVSQLGCHIIDLCFPTSSESEREVMRLVCEGRRKGEIRQDLEILVMCRANPKDIDSTIAAVTGAGFGLDEITFLLFTSGSALHVKYKLGAMLLKKEGLNPADLYDAPLSFFHAANRRMIGEVTRYAVSRGVRHIEFGAEDASRAPLDWLIDLIREAVAAGARRYVFADTTGSLTPEATRYYCSNLAAAFPDLELVTHFHDDFNLATINTVTGVLHGFTTFTTTINGLGERAGNAAMHSVLATLKYLYGLEVPGFRYDRLHIAKRLLENLTGVPVQAKEPVIGRNVFAHESGIHTHGVGIFRCMYEPIPCEEVGGKGRFVYGKHSGTASLLALLQKRQNEIECPVDADFALAVLEEVKDLRSKMAVENDPSLFIRQYYEHLDRLGLSEDEVVGLARTVAGRYQARSVSR